MVFNSRTVALVMARIAQTLTDTCTIERETGAVGAMGEPLTTASAVYSDIPCRVITTGGNRSNAVQDVGASEAIVERYRLIVSASVVLGVDDRVTVSDGTVYLVVGVEDRLTDGVFAGAVLVRERGADGS